MTDNKYVLIFTLVQDSNKAVVVHIQYLKEAELRQLVDTLADHRWENPNFCNSSIRELNNCMFSCTAFISSHRFIAFALPSTYYTDSF
jgi:hypothetical protein